ncbi:hydroxyproline O-galactosyltransferase HPGT1-like [Hibiscus syriacus]|uniref:hydroxyproline O-galactosyltransferase HPGT1-like n=1 Tax=Hibiscus syriacus TaxID=106335 RepID=UPI00192500BB|nr:hydroxyproline O-galactosyltransferase HPGT1-like [Hibiscus syriacus]
MFDFPGATLKKMEKEKGIVSRFVIGRSADRGDNLDRSVDDENRQTNDFMILDQVEAPGELPKKAKMFFALAADRWNADFYAKVNNDVYVNIDAFGATLTSHLDKARVYIFFFGINLNLLPKSRTCSNLHSS